jgi:hypothetical protein
MVNTSKKRKGGGLLFDPAPMNASSKKLARGQPDADLALATRLQEVEYGKGEEYENALGSKVYSPGRESKGGNNDNFDLIDTPESTTKTSGVNDKLKCWVCQAKDPNLFSKTQMKRFFKGGQARCKSCVEKNKRPVVEKDNEAEENIKGDPDSASDGLEVVTDCLKNSKGDTDSVSVGSEVVSITDRKKPPLCNSCNKPIWMYLKGDSEEPGCDCCNVQLSRTVSILDHHGVSFAQFLGISAEILNGTIGPERKALRERYLEMSVAPIGVCRDSYIELMTKRGGLPTVIAEHMWDLFGRNVAPSAQVFVEKIADGRAQLDHIEHLMDRYIHRFLGRDEKEDGGAERSSEEEKKENE